MRSDLGRLSPHPLRPANSTSQIVAIARVSIRESPSQILAPELTCPGPGLPENRQK